MNDTITINKSDLESAFDRAIGYKLLYNDFSEEWENAENETVKGELEEQGMKYLRKWVACKAVFRAMGVIELFNDYVETYFSEI